MTPADGEHINREIKMQTPGKSTTEAGTGPDSEKRISGPLNRSEILDISSETIRQIHKRIGSVRFKEQGGDRARIAHIRAFTALLQTYAGILKDSEIADLEKRIATLEAQKEGK